MILEIFLNELNDLKWTKLIKAHVTGLVIFKDVKKSFVIPFCYISKNYSIM